MASKSKSRRRVLRASCLLAALIVAGSSFAWFSSKDEVTNRLSASANYGVSIVEDFQPPKNFLPGQKVNKDVAVVNTGNVDAFVRTWIDGEMSLVKKLDWANSTDADNGSGATIKNFSTGLQKTADDQTKLTGVNLNWYKDSKYYKELSQIKSENPLNSTTSTTAADEGTNQLARFSEVQSIQAGGVLVYHDVDGTNPATAASAEYYYVLEQATTITASDGTTKTYPAGTYVHTPGSCVKNDGTIPAANKVEIPYNYYGNIDTSQFFPETEGLYLFRRNVGIEDTANTKDDYEYTGYYFIQGNAASKTTASEKDNDKSDLDKRDRTVYNPVYLALCYDTSHTQRSDYVLPDTALTTRTTDPTKDEVLPVTLNDVKLYTATERVLKSYTGTTTTYTANGDSISEPVEDTSQSGYSYKITKNGTDYYGTNKTGTYKKYDTDLTSIVNTDNQTVAEVVTANGFAWNYNADAATTTYKLNDGTSDVVLSGAPVADVTHAGYDLKVTDGTNEYYHNTSADKYYKYDTSTTSIDTNTPYTYSTTTAAATTGVLSAEYGAGDELIKINVKLANLDNAPTASTAETWSVIDAAATNPDKKWTFYYNNDVEEGASTTKLIDYVELDESVKDEAFLAFDFDLNVFMESVQVVLDEQGNEVCTPIVAPWGNTSSTEPNVANTNFNAATGDKGGSSAEIEYITWTNT